ncbi:MAG: DnaJ C-terminal domain-containing protein [Microbacteriaceae bacterium]
MASQDWFDKDFYKLLEVSKDASEADIKKSYRKLARKYHPDSNSGDSVAEEKFKSISEAYSVLSDKEQRAEYDQMRALGAGGARFASGAGGSSGGAGFEDVFSNLFGGGQQRRNTRTSTRTGANYEDIFNLFGDGGGGFSGGGFGGYPQNVKGSDVSAQVTLSFKDAASGSTMKLQTADGQSINVKIPAGVKDGQTIRLAGKGRPSPSGGASGDMLVKVSVRKHDVFTREGNNLRVTVPITIFEATQGGTIEVPTLDGQTVKLKIAAGTSSGKVLRVKTRGIKTAKAHGDLLATVEIVVPNHLSAEASAALEVLKGLIPDENPREDLLRKAL